MTRRDAGILLAFTLLAWALLWAVSAFEPAPGYMDADYYFAVGLRLATGRGLSEPFLWNYLDHPSGLPHPANAYWMPLASFLAAAAMKALAAPYFKAARQGFIFIAALLPALTAWVGLRLHGQRAWAWGSAVLAVLSGSYLVFLPTTDTFGLYMLWGTLFLLALGWHSPWMPFGLGVLSALMHLTRADGILWLFVAFLLFAFGWIDKNLWMDGLPLGVKSRPCLARMMAWGGLVLGYLLLMLPWFWRNWMVFGAPLAPGGYRALFLTHYNQTFAFPPESITLLAWLQSGWLNILRARLWALKINLGTLLAVQGEIIWLPFIVWGFWRYRQDVRVRAAALAWLLTFLAMTLAFPFAGARGGFFHSGVALQPFFWALAWPGMQSFIRWLRRRGHLDEHANRVLPVIFLLLTAGVTGFFFATHCWVRSWGAAQARYQQVEAWLDLSADDDRPVVVANPPGYWLAAGRAALALPDGGADAVLRVAKTYGAGYLLLEPGSYPPELAPFYETPHNDGPLRYLRTLQEIRIYAIQTP